MHRGEECDDRVDLRGREILAVCRHVAATLNDLANDLIAREARGSVVERRPAQPALAVERVTIAALLALHEQSALELERSAALNVIDGSGRTAPRVHHRRPWRECAQPGESADSSGGGNYDHNCERAA